MTRFAQLALVAALVGLSAGPAGAQLVRGTVADTLARQPVGGAVVLLRDTAGATRATAFADSLGRFRLQPPGPGRYRIVATQLGYAAATMPTMALAVGDTVTLALSLSPDPVGLKALTASATRQGRNRDRFFRDERTGSGTFLSPDELARSRMTTVAQLAGRLPLVTVMDTPDGSGLFLRLGGNPCPVAVWVDGSYVPQESATTDAVRGEGAPGRAGSYTPQDVASTDAGMAASPAGRVDAGAAWLPPMPAVRAVEFYERADAAPIEYQRPPTRLDRTCGVLLLWTRAAIGK